MSATIAFVALHVRPSAQAVPLASATVAASLPQQKKSRVVLVDLFLHQSVEEMVDAVMQPRPTIVAFSLYVWNHQPMLDLARALKARDPHMTLIAGGPEVTALSQQFESLNVFDTLVCGEGEGVLGDIITAIEQDNPLQAVYRNTSSMDLTQQQSPWLSGLLVPGEGVLWEVSRGCPFKCSFCFDARGDHGVRTIPYARLERELSLFAAHNVAQVWVLDSTFNYPLERGKELLRLIQRMAPHIHFHLEAKVEFIDEELAELLSQIQCSVQIGLQSANPEVVRHVHRHFDSEQFQHNIGLLHAAGVTYGIDLMYGLPGDDEQGLRNSLEFVLHLQPNHIDLFPLAVLPGTELYQQQQHYGLHAETAPPYRLISSDSMSQQAMTHCRALAVWTDLFYNTGRAMGFFLDICQALDVGAVEKIEAFGDWLSTTQSLSLEDLENGVWSSDQVLQWQKDFYLAWLEKLGHENLCAAIDDLICFHAGWSQAQLEEDVPLPERSVTVFSDQQAWRWSGTVSLQRFHYDINDWLLVGGDLIEQAEYGDPVGSVALFFRSDCEAQCVTIDGIDAQRFPCTERLPSVDHLIELGAVIEEEVYRHWLKQAVDFGLVIADGLEGR